MKVVVLVPRRADAGWRDHLWGWVRDRWRREHPEWSIHEGWHPAELGPFNRSAGVNAAAREAGDWDVAVIADSDTFADAAQVRQAVDVALVDRQITFAYDRYCYLNRAGTKKVIEGFQGNWWPFVEWTMTGTCSNLVVVPRSLWDAVGGFDEGFVGWGMEDVGFSLACQAIGGGMRRISGDVWHLHHNPSPENNTESPLYLANVARMKRYEACNYDPAAMRDLLVELGLVTGAPSPAKKPTERKRATAKTS